MPEKDLEEYSLADVVGVYAARILGNINYIVMIRGADWGDLVLPIFIGEAEAAAIEAALKGFIPRRPMTHDLVVNMLDALGVKVERITIDALINNIYTATIVLRDDKDRLYYVDARPSDSIAIALRARSPIYVAERLKEYAVSEKEMELPG